MPAPAPHPELDRLRAQHVLGVVDVRRSTTLRGWPDVDDVARALRLERRLVVTQRWDGAGLAHVVRRRSE